MEQVNIANVLWLGSITTISTQNRFVSEETKQRKVTVDLE